jgi:hypothetical protein
MDSVFIQVTLAYDVIKIIFFFRYNSDDYFEQTKRILFQLNMYQVPDRIRQLNLISIQKATCKVESSGAAAIPLVKGSSVCSRGVK